MTSNESTKDSETSDLARNSRITVYPDTILNWCPPGYRNRCN